MCENSPTSLEKWLKPKNYLKLLGVSTKKFLPLQKLLAVTDTNHIKNKIILIKFVYK